jgi:predicted ester cyclase
MRMSAENSTAKNKEIVRQFFEEVINNERSDLVEGMIATNLVLHAPLVYEEPIEGGPDDVRRIVQKFRTAFPDIHVNVDEDLVAENDFVVARWIGTGRHEGEIEASDREGEVGRVEPTGRQLEAHGMTSFHFSADNKIDKASTVMVEMRAWEEHLNRVYDESQRQGLLAEAGKRPCRWINHLVGH